MLFAIVSAWLVTTGWVAIDASRFEWTQPVKPDGFRLPPFNRPLKWLLGSLLLWPIVFPVYVYRRANAPLKNPTVNEPSVFKVWRSRRAP